MSGTVENALYNLLNSGIPLTMLGNPITPQNPLPIVQAGSGGESIVTGTLTTTVGGSGAATLAATAGKTTYIRGFVITGAPVVAVVNGIVTITGLTNTLSMTLTELVTALTIIQQYFGEIGIPASGPNTSIALNVPSITGGSIINVFAWGYQL